MRDEKPEHISTIIPRVFKQIEETMNEEQKKSNLNEAAEALAAQRPFLGFWFDENKKMQLFVQGFSKIEVLGGIDLIRELIHRVPNE
jgi:hypothetical protein